MSAHKRRVTIWDLDETLVNINHRLPHILCSNPDWNTFHSLTHEDKVYPHALLLYNALMTYGVAPVICTSRPEINRQATEAWLQANGIRKYLTLKMRADTDHRSSVEVKQHMLDIIQTSYHVTMAFEDQPSVVEMYRAAGVPVWASDDTGWRNGTYAEKSTKQREEIPWAGIPVIEAVK